MVSLEFCGNSKTMNQSKVKYYASQVVSVTNVKGKQRHYNAFSYACVSN